MLTLKPSFNIYSTAIPSSDVQVARLERLPASHSHVSYFRSLHLDMQIYSPSIQMVKQPGLVTSRARPVFRNHDKIEGRIILDPSYSQSGRLTISLEGTFEYLSVEENADEYLRKPTATKHRHIFLSSSAAIPLSPVPDSRTTIREALSIRKRPSTSSLNSPTQRSCEFTFELSRGSWPGEEIPQTLSSITPTGDSQRQASTEKIQISYRIMAVWEACDGSGNQAILETPVLIQPDADFQYVDGAAVEPQSWLEMALMQERPIPFTCAVTLPHLHSFSRCTSIPYFVVFTTNTRSPSLIKEIAADATIVVSLVRRITVSRSRPSQSPILPDTPPASDESDGRTSPFALPSKILKRSLRTPTRSHSRDELFSENKPPRADPPQEAFSVARALETQLSIGFQKRPWTHDAPQELPDGLHKGYIGLSKDMLPSLDWLGMSVKYYFDVSVSVGHDVLRARVPIRVY